MNDAPSVAFIRGRSPAGRLEGSLTVLTFFFLTYSLPVDWFRLPGATEDGSRVFQGNTAAFIAVFGGLVALQLGRFVAQPELIVWVFRYSPLAVVFVALAMASTLWSTDPATTARRATSLALVTLFAGFLALRYSPKQLLALLSASFALGSVLNLVWFAAVPSYAIQNGVPSGIHLNKNGLGQTASFAMMVFWLTARAWPAYRFLLYPFAALSAGLIVYSTAASPLIALALVIPMSLVYQAFRGRKTLYGAVGVSLIGGSIISVFAVTANLSFLLGLVGKDATFTGRLPLWDSLWPEIAEKPILGYGWHGYFGGYFTPVHEIWIDLPWQPPHAHNTFIDLTLDLGLLGAAIYAVFLLGYIVLAARYIRATPGAIGLWPVIHVSLVLIYSFSETLKPDRDIAWVILLTLAIIVRFSLSQGDVASDGLPERRRRYQPDPSREPVPA